MTDDALTWTFVAAYGLIEVITRGAIVRRLWLESMRVFILMELGSMALVRRLVPPRYVVQGSCQKRGVCCQQILGDPPGFVKHSFLLTLWIGYHRFAHRFEPVARGPNDEVIFSCGHLQTDGRCDIYRYRPLLCRNYPVLPFYEPPKILPGCSFSVAPRVVVQMKKRKSLNIVNPVMSVHHPSPDSKGETSPEHFELIDDT